jgi:hypothetical protein
MSYRLLLGTSLGGSNLYDSRKLTVTSTTVTNLPDDGRTIYARLISRFALQSQFIDYTYNAFLQPLVIIAVQRLSNGHILLTGIGRANLNCTVKWAPNLSSSPQNLASIKTDAQGNFQYEDGQASAPLARYYWVTSP